MKKNTVVEFAGRAQFSDALTELLRTGAQQLILQTVETELSIFMEQFAGKNQEDGRAAVVRNGYHPEREIQTGIGPVTVKIALDVLDEYALQMSDNDAADCLQKARHNSYLA